MTRRFRKENISELTWNLVDIISRETEPELYIELLREGIQPIIQDADIFHGMTESKAVDALQELSNLAAVFFGEEPIYSQICEKIRCLRASYPIVERGQSDVPTYFLPRGEEAEN